MTLRVVHIDAGRGWRGGQRQVFLLAQALRDRGVEPLVIGAADAPLVGRLRAAGLAASSVRMLGDWDVRAAYRVRKIVRAWSPDLVHAHDARSHAIALLALHLPLRPIVPRARGVPPLLIVTRRVMRQPGFVSLKYSHGVARFIAISDAVRDSMIAGGVASDRITVVHSGVPTPTIDHRRDWRVECGWPDNTVVAGVVGAMTAEKGITHLDAIARQLSAPARDRVRLVLLGGGAPSGRDMIGGIDVYRAGFVDDIYPAMGGLDLLWHPSGSEGLGTAVLDAMALGIPPIVFNSGGIAELIENGRNGIIVPLGDTAAFATAASVLALDSSARVALAAAGPERAAQFSVERMVSGTMQVYEELVPSKGAA
jgi:glycosyltransferase involved in cell wall biosynthesis